MNAYWSRPLAYPWPPFIYALAVIVALLLGTIHPLPPLAGDQSWLFASGVLLVILALAIDLWALLTLRFGHTTVMPHRSTSHLVTTGPFRFSRNPIYLGYTLMTTGIGLISGNSWYLAAAAVAAVLTYIVAIRAEEMHLLARFGIDFERYCQRTRCWI